MNEKKKGTGRKTGTNHVQSYINTVSNICLIFFAIFLILFYVGEFFGNELLAVFGLGLGTASGLIQTAINTKED